MLAVKNFLTLIALPASSIISFISYFLWEWSVGVEADNKLLSSFRVQLEELE